MIQRVQSLYLFAVAVLAGLLCAFAPLQFVAPDSADILHLATYTKWPLLVLGGAIGALALTTLLLFKKRLLQARLCVVNAFLNLGFYALVALYGAYIIKGVEPVQGILLPEGSDYYITLWAAIPLVNLVLSLMALRRILKDEALVRAADRLR